MKNKKLIFGAMIFLSIIIAFCLSAVFGQDQLPQGPMQAPVSILVADGSSSGTYQSLLKEMAQQDNIAAAVSFKEIPSDGAITNLDKLVNNQVSIAFMHSDVLNFNAQTKDLSKFQTLLALHKEDVHFVALAVSHRTTGGWAGYGAKPVQINTIEDLRGMKVGAAGGGWITANVVNSLAQVGYTVLPSYNSGGDVLKALQSGEIDAAEFTGGAPLGNLSELGPDYKILSIPDRDVQMLRGQYVPSTVTYVKMRPDVIQTVAARCLVIGRVYTVPKYVKALHDFRAAFFNDLASLQQTPGMHPKWSEVDATNHGPWPWMDLGDKDTIPKAKDAPPPQ